MIHVCIPKDFVLSPKNVRINTTNRKESQKWGIEEEEQIEDFDTKFQSVFLSLLERFSTKIKILAADTKPTFINTPTPKRRSCSSKTKANVSTYFAKLYTYIHKLPSFVEKNVSEHT